MLNCIQYNMRRSEHADGGYEYVYQYGLTNRETNEQGQISVYIL